ncbi:MAG: sulfotransferase [Pseudorhodobacter sp.]|nr:sulfotransferase [Pseudorhodobacter sp.]
MRKAVSRSQVTNLESLAQSTRVHFIVGLPRSGSTMLAALLNQNPRVCATGPSAAYHLFSNLYTAMSEEGETASLLDDAQRASVLKAVIHAVHNPKQGTKPVVFDTNRKWLFRIDQLVELFPLCQFIVCVRNPAQILSSLEKTRRASVLRQSRLFHSHESLEQRVLRLMAADGMVGSSMMLVRDVLEGPHAERCLVLDYERLAQQPAGTMQALYRFVREPEFGHDFEDFSFDAPEFDAFLNTPGLHKIEGPLRPRGNEMLLPPQIAQKYESQAFWRDISSPAKMVLP